MKISEQKLKEIIKEDLEQMREQHGAVRRGASGGTSKGGPGTQADYVSALEAVPNTGSEEHPSEDYLRAQIELYNMNKSPVPRWGDDADREEQAAYVRKSRVHDPLQELAQMREQHGAVRRGDAPGGEDRHRHSSVAKGPLKSKYQRQLDALEAAAPHDPRAAEDLATAKSLRRTGQRPPPLRTPEGAATGPVRHRPLPAAGSSMSGWTSHARGQERGGAATVPESKELDRWSELAGIVLKEDEDNGGGSAPDKEEENGEGPDEDTGAGGDDDASPTDAEKEEDFDKHMDQKAREIEIEAEREAWGNFEAAPPGATKRVDEINALMIEKDEKWIQGASRMESKQHLKSLVLRELEQMRLKEDEDLDGLIHRGDIFIDPETGEELIRLPGGEIIPAPRPGVEQELGAGLGQAPVDGEAGSLEMTGPGDAPRAGQPYSGGGEPYKGSGRDAVLDALRRAREKRRLELDEAIQEEISALIIEKGEKWIQGAEKDIERRGTEGVCTGKKFGGPTCRAGTKRYNLAKTFRKMAKKRKKKKSKK